MVPLPTTINVTFSSPLTARLDKPSVNKNDHDPLSAINTNGDALGPGTEPSSHQKVDSPLQPLPDANLISFDEKTESQQLVDNCQAASIVQPMTLTAPQLPESIPKPVDSIGVSRQLAYPVLQSEAPLASSTRLRRMLMDDDKLVVCPGVFDGLSARIALSVGFDAMYMTGAGTTASKLGQPDLGIAQLYDMRANAEMISGLDPSVPVIADMDTGFGGPILIDRAVTEYARAGVAAFHIEDQILQKRCGHLAGKAVVSLEEFVIRIKAAKAAKEKARSDIVLIGRTDALQKKGYDECIRRLRAARDAGADVGLLEGVTSKDMARQVVKDMAPMPLLLNMVEHGATPIITTKEAQEMGFRIMIFSFASLGPAFAAIRDTFHRLKTEGVTGLPKDCNPKAIFEVCGLSEKMIIDELAGGTMEKPY